MAREIRDVRSTQRVHVVHKDLVVYRLRRAAGKYTQAHRTRAHAVFGALTPRVFVDVEIDAFARHQSPITM